MKRNLIIFGSGDIAQLAHYYFSTDSEFKVVAFTVDSEYVAQGQFCGLPVVPFNAVLTQFDPNEYVFFVALSYSRLNAVRKEKYLAVKAMGYELVSYVSSRATVLNDNCIGANCFILEDNTIQPFVKIGNNITLWSGNHIGHHSTINDHTFIASHVVVSGGVEIGEQCFIGVNATLRDHIQIGSRCVVGAGSLILESTPDDSLYIGSRTEPASIKSSSLKRI